MRRRRLSALAGIVAALPFAVVTGCTSGSGSPATFTLRLGSPTIEVHVSEQAELGVTITRSGGFTAPVTVSFMAAGGVSAKPIEVTGDAGTLVLNAAEDAAVGTSFFTVTAEGGGTTRTETLTVRVRQLVARVTDVRRSGSDPSRQVRQGSGAVTLEVDGTNLDKAALVGVGDLQVEEAQRTPTRLVLTVTVPHGADPGPKDLVLRTEGGDTTYEAALLVTPITASPAGSDETGAGTSERPYRTLTHALGRSESGDSVLLLAGEYGEGEEWPRAAGDVGAPNVPAGVHVLGEGADVVTLVGAPGAVAAGLVFAGGGGASDLTVAGFTFGFYTRVGEVTLIRVRAAGNVNGLGSSGGVTRAEDSEFSENQENGVLADGAAALELISSYVKANREMGISLGGAATLNAAWTNVTDNWYSGIVARGSARLLLEGGMVFGNKVVGLHVSEEASADLVGPDFVDNTSGLMFAGASLRMRSVTVKENRFAGLEVAGSPERVDLGTFKEGGFNQFGGNGVEDTDNLRDLRADRDSVEVPIIFTVSMTTFEGLEPVPDVYVGPYSDTALRLIILGTNNVIQFY